MVLGGEIKYYETQKDSKNHLKIHNNIMSKFYSKSQKKELE